MHKVHFELDRETYLKRVAAGEYETQWGDLHWREALKDYDLFHSYLVRVGHDWGWDRMADRFGEAAMNPKLADPETHLRELMEGNRIIGYTLILPPASKLKERFWSSATHNKVIEIENLGLFPEECGGGRGWSFFEMQLADLFQRYDTVYWSMSSTNHPRLQSYYERQGMKTLAVDKAPALVA